MGIALMVEVLDHYHGPRSRKLWLIAWAEKVTEGLRTGYCKRAILAHRLGVTPARVSNIARELEDEGTVKRLGGGVWGKTAVFELLPLDGAQGNPRANPTQGNPRANPTKAPRANAQGNPRANAQGNPRANPNPDNPDKPSSSSPRTTRTGSRGLAAATADDDFDSSTTNEPAPAPEPAPREPIRVVEPEPAIARPRTPKPRRRFHVPNTDIPESEWVCARCGAKAADGVRFAVPPDLCADCAAKAEAGP